MNGWKFLRLVYALRQASLPISSQDVREALICLKSYPSLSEKQILKALFIHRPQDSLTFETIWIILVENSTSALQLNSENDCRHSGEEEQTSAAVGGQGIGHGFGGISLTNGGLKSDLNRDSNPLSSYRFRELLERGVEFEDLVNTVLTEMNYYTWINSYDLAFQRGILCEDEWYKHQNNRTALIKEVKQRVVAAQINQENSWQPLVKQHWLFKPLSTLSEEEKSLVKSSIRKWSRKLAIRTGQRWKNSPRGSIDITRIVQQSAQWDGYLFRLTYRRRIPKAPELVVLCDVSNSMAAFVEFLIYLVSCLRDRFRKIRVFFFIDAVWDVTDFVWQEDLEEIKQEIKSWGHKVSLGYSDYGAVFKELAGSYLTSVPARATMIILGDGKNNYRPAQTEYLALVAGQVKHVFWLNPLEVDEWNEPDNILKDYGAYCTKVYKCRSASDLHTVVKDVF